MKKPTKDECQKLLDFLKSEESTIEYRYGYDKGYFQGLKEFRCWMIVWLSKNIDNLTMDLALDGMREINAMLLDENGIEY